jgi:hypothetical protein
MSKLIEVLDEEIYMNSPHERYYGHSQMWISAYNTKLERSVICTNTGIANIKLERLDNKIAWCKSHTDEMKKIKSLSDSFWNLKKETNLSIWTFHRVSKGKIEHPRAKEIIKSRAELFSFVDSFSSDTISRVELMDESVRPSFIIKRIRAINAYPELIRMIHENRIKVIEVKDLEDMSREDERTCIRIIK